MVLKYGQYWDKSEKTMVSGGEGSSRDKMLSNKEEDLAAVNMDSLTKLKQEPERVKLNPDLCQGQAISS